MKTLLTLVCRLATFPIACAALIGSGSTTFGQTAIVKGKPPEADVSWDATDEQIFLTLEQDLPVLKAIINLLVSSDRPEKKHWAIEALAYDRRYADVSEVFGLNYRTDLLLQLMKDKDVKVRVHAVAAARCLTLLEARVLAPAITQIQDSNEEDMLVRKEAGDTADFIAKQKEDHR